jgi:hypothetical protein
MRTIVAMCRECVKYPQTEASFAFMISSSVVQDVSPRALSRVITAHAVHANPRRR